MKYQFETKSGVRVSAEADNQQQALVMLEQQYGPGSISQVDGQAPAAEQSGGDPHGWAKAFELAAART